MPNSISIGTKIGAISAHFAEAEPMNRFSTATSSTMPTISSGAGRFRARRLSAPPMAITVSISEAPNSTMKCAITKARMMYPPMSAMDFVPSWTRSRSDFTEPTAMP